MSLVIYDVAVSADGLIAGASGDVSLFPHEGAVVDDYRERLAGYRHCVLGRRTYEFGYAFGLTPGSNPYPGMQSYVASSGIELPDDNEVEVWSTDSCGALRLLKERADGPIYLCGGGELAGAFLVEGLIDRLRLKRAPILLGTGTPLFGQMAGPLAPRLIESRQYEDGVLYQEFDLTS